MYDGQELLDAFRERGAFPAIHKAIFEAVSRRVTAGGIVDLCCSTGLLGEQIRQRLGTHVVGIEGNTEAVLRGVAAGVKVPIMTAKIDRSKLDVIAGWLKTERIRTVVARRCFPELFGADLEFGQMFIKKLAEIDVGELVLQGRVISGRSTNPLSSLAKEIALCEPTFYVKALDGPCAYLRRRP